MLIEDPIILLVDDSEDDALLLRRVFERVGFSAPLQFVRDGEQMIDYLNGAGAYGDRTKFPLPTAVLLDLKMPRESGFDLLTWIRQQSEHKLLRVYILSASGQTDDIRQAYDLGANSYLVKPGTLDELTVMAGGLLAWLRLSHFYVPEPDSSIDAA